MKYNDHFYKIPSVFNIKDIMNLAVKTSAAILAVKRKTNSLALKNVSIIKDSNGMNKIGINQNEEPYKFTYMPELIDVYPPNMGVKASLALVI